MAEDNTIRIEFVSEDRGGTPSGGGSSGPSESPGDQRRRSRKRLDDTQDEAFDARREAMRTLAREKRAEDVRREYNLAKFGSEVSPTEVRDHRKKTKEEDERFWRERRAALAGGISGIGALAGALGVPGAGTAASGVSAALLARSPLGMMLPLAAGAIGAGRAIGGAMDDATSRAAMFSPVAARAQADAEIRQLMGDIRRSRQLGDNAAEYIRAQSEFSQALQDFKTMLVNTFLPAMTSLLKGATPVIEGAAPGAGGWWDKTTLGMLRQLQKVEEVFPFLGSNAKDSADLLNNQMEFKKQVREKQKKEEEGLDRILNGPAPPWFEGIEKIAPDHGNPFADGVPIGAFGDI